MRRGGDGRVVVRAPRPLRRPAAAAGELARLFALALALVPIAIAYHVAHYLSFFLVAGRYAIPLLSDPFGFGRDLFGTKDYRIAIGVIDARTVWYTAVAAIVAGHVVSVVLAHVIALRAFPGDGRAALASQLPMLAPMVGYTVTSLSILAEPIIAA